MSYDVGIEQVKASAVLHHPEARTKGRPPMADAIVPRERLLYASCSPPCVHAAGSDDSHPMVTALVWDPTDDGDVGYSIRGYSLAKGKVFYRFPKSGGHWSQAVIRQEWYRETETLLPDWVFETAGGATL